MVRLWVVVYQQFGWHEIVTGESKMENWWYFPTNFLTQLLHSEMDQH